MLDLPEHLARHLARLGLTDTVSLPGWIPGLAAAVLVFICAIAAMRGGSRVKSVFGAGIILICIAAVAATWVLNGWVRGDFGAEGRTIEGRAFELSMRALMPGSPFACLDGAAGEMIQDACEKALFASPEATAGAVSYVRAQLSLLSAGRHHASARGESYWNVLPTTRRAIESDHFGIVAHLFSMSPGCGHDECNLFDLLQDPTRVKANLAGRTFEAYVRAHTSDWASGVAGGASHAVSDSGLTGASARSLGKPTSKLFFPSSSSIPPVNIMTAEPSTSQQQTHEATASAEAPARPRRQPQASSQAGQPPGSEGAPARAGPMQITPPIQ